MADIWTQRDLPVLRAIVDLFEEQRRSNVRARDIEQRTGFDHDAVQNAIRNLYSEPYLSAVGRSESQSGTTFVGPPNGAALRAAGTWPTPESVVDRLAAALEQAANEDGRGTEEKGKLKQLALGLRGFGYQVAIGALGGAGGSFING